MRTQTIWYTYHFVCDPRFPCKRILKLFDAVQYQILTDAVKSSSIMHSYVKGALCCFLLHFATPFAFIMADCGDPSAQPVTDIVINIMEGWDTSTSSLTFTALPHLIPSTSLVCDFLKDHNLRDKEESALYADRSDAGKATKTL